MEKRQLEIGDIVQISPEHERFPGQLLQVTEPKEWGCQGCVYMDTDLECVRFDGRAYARIKWDDMEFIGHSEWIWEKKEDDKAD